MSLTTVFTTGACMRSKTDRNDELLVVREINSELRELIYDTGERKVLTVEELYAHYDQVDHIGQIEAILQLEELTGMKQF